MELALDETAWILIAIVVLLLAALLVWWLARTRRTKHLHDEFGPEYEHTVATAGDRAKAEDELETRRKRVESYELRDLDPADRARLRNRWRDIQTRFVDDPGGAVADAAHLIEEAMERRGYPVGEIHRQEADLSVHYPEEVQEYRRAWAIAERNRRGEATTEELREATVCYRNLFDHLVGHDETTREAAS